MKKIEFETVKDFFEALVDPNGHEDGATLWLEVLSNSIRVYIGDVLGETIRLDIINGYFCSDGGYFDLVSENYWSLSFVIKSNDLKVGKTYKMKIEHEEEEEPDDIIEL
jgi:hypothetical protein